MTQMKGISMSSIPDTIYMVEDPHLACLNLIFMANFKISNLFQNVLDDQLSAGQEHDMTQMKATHMSSIPVTLYMVEAPPPTPLPV